MTVDERIEKDPSLLLDVDVLFEMAGAGSKKHRLGCFQIFACAWLIMTENTGGFFIYSLHYWEKIPKWQCHY